MVTKWSAIILLAFFIAGFVSIASAGKPETGFLNRTVFIGGKTYHYQVYVPAEWNKSKKWPVVLFLHGAGERGDDGLLQSQVGIATAIRLHRDRFPCIVVFPQCRRDAWWTADEMEAQALKALERSLKEFKGASDRVYLTGLSMGGYGAWDLAYKHPGKFAALVLICGGIRPPGRVPAPKSGPFADPNADAYALVAQKVGKTPVWIFHGGADTTVPPAESRKMNDALKAAGANVKYTEYEGVGHNSWDRAYAEPELMSWLLSQQRTKNK
jgi:predicted peptidase